MNLETAINIANKAHAGVKDKMGKPYILHPMCLASNPGLTTEEEWILAILHDVVEDTEYTLEDIARFGFSERVMAALDAITHRPNETNKQYWLRLRENELAVKVKLIDLKHNTSPQRMNGLKDDERKYLEGKYARARICILRLDEN